MRLTACGNSSRNAAFRGTTSSATAPTDISTSLVPISGIPITGTLTPMPRAWAMSASKFRVSDSTSMIRAVTLRFSSIQRRA